MNLGVSIWEQAAFGTPAPTGISFLNLIGKNGGTTTTFEPVWPESAAYTFRTSAMSTPYIASSSASDAAAGTGARTARVTGVTTSYASFSEDLTLNGQSSVNLVTANVLGINSITALTAGSGGVSAGTIRVGTGSNSSGVPAVVEAHMVAGNNFTTSFIYTVPANTVLLLKDICFSSRSTTATDMEVVIDSYVNGGVLKRQYLTGANNAGGAVSMGGYILSFAAKTQLMMQTLSGAGTGPFYANANGLLINTVSNATPNLLF